MKLNSLIIDQFRLTKPQKNALEKLGLKTLQDLLFHFPTRYINPMLESNIANLRSGETASFCGTIKKITARRTFRGHKPMAEATIVDGEGKIKAVWFNQPYIAKMFPENSYVRLSGLINQNQDGSLNVTNPKIEKADPLENWAGTSKNFYPIYPESKGITSNWFYHAIKKILQKEILDEIKDPLDIKILKKYSLPTLKTALIWIHAPKKKRDALSAKKRFSFEEILYIQIKKQKDRKLAESTNTYEIEYSEKEVAKFIKKFPFKLTASQQKAVEEILEDISTPNPMSRLLEGDVGSGKTAVAAVAVFATINSKPKGRKYGHLQSAYMVPTEILAKQHFDNFIKFFEGTGIEIGLITSSGCYKFPSKVKPAEATKISKSQLLRWIESGQISIIIGTHSLIQKTVKFKDLALVIIDEQHRFGTKQRQQISQKDCFTPHLLSMTATPIPRTLALTIYGDLDLTLIEQMPSGRKPVITKIVTPAERKKTYEKIRRELKAGRQVYVICPRIDEPDPEKQFALYAKSVKEEARRLRKEVFPEFEIAELHSKMKPTEKDSVLKKFENGQINILVSTSVVEVGVNIPNATNIVIEGAERFGLSQLHQLRGRVLRSNHQAYCYIFTDSKNEYTLERLKALKEAKNGFELAEYDLGLRGAGELIGGKQWGISDLGMEAIKNLKMVEAARNTATEIVASDPELKKCRLISEKIEGVERIHFE